MYFRNLHAFSRRSLKGHYAAACEAALFCPMMQLLMKLVPVLLSALLITAGRMSPQALFLGKNRVWVLFALLWGMLGFAVLLPVRCGMWSWFTQLLGLEQPGQGRVFFRSTHAYLRGVCFFGAAALLRWLALLPFAVACTLAAAAFHSGAGLEEAGLWLFAGVQGLAAAVWAAVFYLRFCVSMAGLPFLFIEDPHTPVLTALHTSQRMLSGHYRQLAAVLLRYLPAALPVVTVPFLLPYLLADVTLFFQIRLREYREEQQKAAY